MKVRSFASGIPARRMRTAAKWPMLNGRDRGKPVRGTVDGRLQMSTQQPLPVY